MNEILKFRTVSRAGFYVGSLKAKVTKKQKQSKKKAKTREESMQLAKSRPKSYHFFRKYAPVYLPSISSEKPYVKSNSLPARRWQTLECA